MITRGPRPADEFALIRTTALADSDLSFKARGILAYLLSRPPGTNISPHQLAKAGTDGERAVTSGLKELENAGYLTSVTTADEDNPTVQLIVTDSKGGGDPTPEQAPAPAKGGAEHLMWLCEQHPWLSPAAVKTAHREIELQELPLALTKYEIRMVELKKSPSSGEWLRWLIEDEQKLKLAEKAQAREAGDKRSWYSVA